MKRICYIFAAAFLLILLFSGYIYAQGISTDAGLTPPKGRFIVRTMMKSMLKSGKMNGSNMEMTTYMYPLVIVYGLKPGITVMVRQMMANRTMKNPISNTEIRGFSDLFLNIKYKLYRKNTESYTFGIAPTLGGTVPTGKENFSSETFDLQAGIYSSYRKNAFGADLNIYLKKADLFGKKPDGIKRGNEIAWNLAVARQFSLDQNAHVTLAPVLERNYMHVFPDKLNDQEQINSGETVVFLSPGFKLTTTKIVFEALLQPIFSQRQNGMQLKRNTGIILGLRFLL
jgi:hypothetical protein